MKWKQFLVWGLVAACVNDYDIRNKKNGVDPVLDSVIYDTSGTPVLTDSVPYTVDTGDDPALEPPSLPEMLVTPEFYDFGELKIHCTDDYVATISSIGNAPLTIDSWDYNNTDGMSMETDIELPLTLDPGEEVIVKFTYEEEDLVADMGRLYIDSNDFMDPHQTITHQGQGVPTGTQTDNFSQGGESKADILFVIDNSCSMGDEQEALAENSDLFIRNLMDSDVDFQIAVITTDSTALRGGIMTKDTANLEDLLKDSIVAGVLGSPYEMGQEFAKLALEPGGSLDAASGFQREDSFLSVIIVTDEEDSSPLDDEDYYDFFISLKEDKLFALHTVVSTVEPDPDGPNPWLPGGGPGGGGGGGGPGGGGPGWRFHTGDTAVVGDTGHTGDTGVGDTGHTGDTGMLDTGPTTPPARQCGAFGERYINQSALLSGTTLNICEGNWGDYVGILAEDSFNPNLIFPLSRVPMEGSITIKAGGIPLKTGWEYDDVGNVVTFDPSQAPEEDELVQIVYDYIEECDE